jgi:hypothetical protein
MALAPFFKLPKGPQVRFASGERNGVVVLSMRQVADLVGYCALYEFEDIIVETMGAELGCLENLDGLDLSRIVYKFARHASGSPRLAESVTPGRGTPLPRRSYDLFLPIFNHPHELFALNAVAGWRERARFAACYICEAWEGNLPAYLLELLRKFDHVFVGVHSTVGAVAEMVGRPCTYLPMGVDALRFHPSADPNSRFIDVCGIGRRSATTHEALVSLAREKNYFYYYDTIQARPVGGFVRNLTFRVSNPREHRVLLSNLLKRSRYFIANRAWADKPSHTRGKEEIAARFYEGAAAGAIMIGEPPRSDDFNSQFGWTDSVVPIPFHAPQVGQVIEELDADPARIAKARRESVANSLLRHDWVYRLKQILAVAGLDATDAMAAREAKLHELANHVLQSSGY